MGLRAENWTMLTTHIRRMLRVSECLAALLQHTHVDTHDDIEIQTVAVAAKVGPERTAEYAACLARHAAAELEMERLQLRDGWPDL